MEIKRIGKKHTDIRPYKKTYKKVYAPPSFVGFFVSGLPRSQKCQLFFFFLVEKLEIEFRNDLKKWFSIFFFFGHFSKKNSVFGGQKTQKNG